MPSSAGKPPARAPNGCRQLLCHVESCSVPGERGEGSDPSHAGAKIVQGLCPRLERRLGCRAGQQDRTPKDLHSDLYLLIHFELINKDLNAEFGGYLYLGTIGGDVITIMGLRL